MRNDARNRDRATRTTLRERAADSDLAALVDPDFFKALCDGTRLAILLRIATAAEPPTVGEVAAGLPVDVSVVSRHVRTLRDAGIVSCERRGKEVRCRLEAAAVAATLRRIADALEACCAAAAMSAGTPRRPKGARGGRS